ncbi:MAG: FAD/NAD(P)-binding protein [Magnetococcales bacterium]|nr:FAD/NAD(P)-binding protein [Magnetococcales bacterium]
MSATPYASDPTIDPALYLPRMARILEVTPLTSREKYFKVELPEPLGHRPGQFVMLSLLGVGEAPISISCGPRTDTILEMVIRNAGSLTQVLHGLKPGQQVGIRGPFGSGFDLEDFYGKQVLCVVGGLGLVPMRSLIQPILAQLDRFAALTIISGCRTPAEELYREEMRAWERLGQETGKVRVIRLVDRTQNLPWDGQVGLVTAPLPSLPIDPDNTVVALCGPPVMYKFVLLELAARGLPHSRIFVDLERRMKCGVGKCGHCQINHVYCCQEGPVFRFDQIAHLPEALQ